LPPVVLAVAAATVVSSHGECGSFRLRAAESGRRTAVVTLVFVTAASSACGGTGAAKIRPCGGWRRVEVVMCARNSVCATDGRSRPSRRHWRGRGGRLHATVMNNFGF